MAERNAALGYMALGKETTHGTAVTPAIYTQYFDQSLETSLNLVAQQPITGTKFRNYQALQGQRSHKGSIKAVFEPNTSAYWIDMLLNKTGTSGGDPYTHSFALNSTDPHSYTIDISTGQQVIRFFGVQANKFYPNKNSNELQANIDVSALGSFHAREIATVSTTTITLTTTYDPSPNNGLVASDLVKITKTDGSSSLNTTVSSVNADGITVVLADSAASFAAGDMIVLRPATSSTTLRAPFLWSNMQFRFGATASAALSATQTRLEDGSSFEIMHDFENADGEKRSGAIDPASLIRTTGDVMFKIKQYFDNPDQEKQWAAISKNACVVRAFSEGTTYEFRLTLNNLRLAKMPIKTVFNKTIYLEEEYICTLDTSDGQAFDVKVINKVSSI